MNHVIGKVSSAVYSPRLKKNIALAMVAISIILKLVMSLKLDTDDN